MNKEQLILKAKELGVENIESLTTNKLLEEAIKKVEDRNLLVSKAESLGIENAKEVESTDLQTLVLAAENTQLASKLEVCKTALGLGEDVEVDETTVSEALKSLVAAAAPAKKESKKDEPKGKTKKTYKRENGSEYGFTDKAPAAFRYLGTHRTQEEWISDKESMEIMISNNLGYVELLKK